MFLAKGITVPHFEEHTAASRIEPCPKCSSLELLLLDATTAATLLAISTKTLWIHTKAGDIPHRRIGHRVLYPYALLREWSQTNSSAQKKTALEDHES